MDTSVTAGCPGGIPDSKRYNIVSVYGMHSIYAGH